MKKGNVYFIEKMTISSNFKVAYFIFSEGEFHIHLDRFTYTLKMSKLHEKIYIRDKGIWQHFSLHHWPIRIPADDAFWIFYTFDNHLRMRNIHTKYSKDRDVVVFWLRFLLQFVLNYSLAWNILQKSAGRFWLLHFLSLCTSIHI